jgi:hypothetical protein
VPARSDVERELEALGADLRRLEGEYNMFFAGRAPRPPSEARARVDALVKRFDRAHLDNVALRFRFSTLQARYSTLADLWDRGLRAREEGRPGPFAQSRGVAGGSDSSASRIVYVTELVEPLQEMDKVHALYEAVMDTRRETGEAVVPFHRFTELVKDQVSRLRRTGAPEVGFRVTVRKGKVNLTARVLKGKKR